MDLDLNGKIAVVTGGDSGIGKATAERLAREGAKVAVINKTLERCITAGSSSQLTNAK